MRSTSALRSLSVLRTAALIALPAGAARLNRFHAPCRSSESFSRPTHTVCDVGPLPNLWLWYSQLSFPRIGRYSTRTTLYGAILVLAVKFFGHLRRSCLRASQGEDRIPHSLLFPRVMAPDCNHDVNRSPDRKSFRKSTDLSEIFSRKSIGGVRRVAQDRRKASDVGYGEAHVEAGAIARHDEGASSAKQL